VKDVKSNAGIVADERELVTLCATRSLSQSPKRRFEDWKSREFLVFNDEFREETILPVSEIVDYLKVELRTQKDSILLKSNVFLW
jgi:hypothetical protein